MPESLAETFRNALTLPQKELLESLPVGQAFTLGQVHDFAAVKGISKRSASQRLPHLIARNAVAVTFTADKGKRYTRPQ